MTATVSADGHPPPATSEEEVHPFPVEYLSLQIDTTLSKNPILCQVQGYANYIVMLVTDQNKMGNLYHVSYPITTEHVLTSPLQIRLLFGCSRQEDLLFVLVTSAIKAYLGIRREEARPFLFSLTLSEDTLKELEENPMELSEWIKMTLLDQSSPGSC